MKSFKESLNLDPERLSNKEGSRGQAGGNENKIDFMVGLEKVEMRTGEIEGMEGESTRRDDWNGGSGIWETMWKPSAMEIP